MANGQGCLEVKGACELCLARSAYIYIYSVVESSIVSNALQTLVVLHSHLVQWRERKEFFVKAFRLTSCVVELADLPMISTQTTMSLIGLKRSSAVHSCPRVTLCRYGLTRWNAAITSRLQYGGKSDKLTVNPSLSTSCRDRPPSLTLAMPVRNCSIVGLLAFPCHITCV